MSKSSRQRQKRQTQLRIVLGVVAAAVIGILFVVVANNLANRTPPPVSDKVAQAYADRTKPPEVKEYTLVTVVGDSYVSGSDMGGVSSTNWTTLISGHLNSSGDFNVTRAAAGGSGYVARGPKNTVFAELLPTSIGPKSDLVVFFGSINDRSARPDQVGAAAATAYADAKRLAPDAKLLVIGPAWMNAQVPADILANRDALKEAALNAGAAWADPIAERWFFDQPALIGTDGTHPTDEGHAYMEKLALPHIQAALGL